MAEEKNEAQEAQKTQYKLVFPDADTRGGKYANVASVHVNTNEVVLDFGYMVPGSNPPEVMVTSRVNMNHNVAAQFMTIIQNAMLDFRNKYEKSKEQK